MVRRDRCRRRYDIVKLTFSRERVMSPIDERVDIDITAPRRRELLVLLCAALNDSFSHQGRWEAGCELRHWQATVPTFERLPRTIIDTVLDEWSESGARLDEVELSGYLDTEDGHRAWGFLALRVGQPRGEVRPKVEQVQMSGDEGRYEVRASIRRSVGEQVSDEK